MSFKLSCQARLQDAPPRALCATSYRALVFRGLPRMEGV